MQTSWKPLLSLVAVTLLVSIRAPSAAAEGIRKNDPLPPCTYHTHTATLAPNVELQSFRVVQTGGQAKFYVKMCQSPRMTRQETVKKPAQCKGVDPISAPWKPVLGQTIPFDVGIYFHRTTAPTCGTKPDFVESYHMSSKQPGCTEGFVTMNMARSPGGPPAWVFADWTCKLAETNDDDNVLRELPDLVVEKSGNATFKSRDPGKYKVSQTLRVCNKGGMLGQSPLLSLSYGHPLGTAKMPANKAFAEHVPVGILKAYQCKDISFTFPKLGYAAKGSYRAFARVDAKNSIQEQSELNNDASFDYHIVTVTATQPGKQR